MLIEAMSKNHTNAELVASCLRSLHYISDVQYLSDRLVFEQEMVRGSGMEHLRVVNPVASRSMLPVSWLLQAKKVLFVMRSCDYDEEVVIKGLSLLCVIFRSPATKMEVWLNVWA